MDALSLHLPTSLQVWGTALTSVFFLVDPFAVIPTFLVMTAGDTLAEKRRVAVRASLTCFLLLSGFGVAGQFLFRLFGITLPAFKLAGGLLLMMVAIDMLQARRSRTNEVDEERAEGCQKEDVGTIPLGIPMLAGPGSISAVMVLVGDAKGWPGALPVFVAIALTSAASYLVLAAAHRVGSFMGDTGIRVLTRLMGLMLTAIAFQFAVDALIDLHVIPGAA